MIEITLSKIGITSSILDITPEEARLVLANLDLLAAGLKGNGYLFTYTIPADITESNLNDEEEIEDWAINALTSILAPIIASDFGKQVTASMSAGAAFGKELMEKNSIKEVQSRPMPPGVPLGAGNRHYGIFSYETT
jgi:hypothetical protein